MTKDDSTLRGGDNSGAVVILRFGLQSYDFLQTTCEVLIGVTCIGECVHVGDAALGGDHARQGDCVCAGEHEALGEAPPGFGCIIDTPQAGDAARGGVIACSTRP